VNTEMQPIRTSIRPRRKLEPAQVFRQPCYLQKKAGRHDIPGVWWSGISATVLKNGRVLLSGGLLINPDGRRGGALALLYDPTTNKFSSTGGTARGAGLSTANLLPDGTVLIAGGWNSGPWSPFAVPPPDAPNALYNAAADQFEELTTGPGRSTYHSATSLTSGKFLCRRSFGRLRRGRRIAGNAI
jgi:hypothetical protein